MRGCGDFRPSSSCPTFPSKRRLFISVWRVNCHSGVTFIHAVALSVANPPPHPCRWRWQGAAGFIYAAQWSAQSWDASCPSWEALTRVGQAEEVGFWILTLSLTVTQKPAARLTPVFMRVHAPMQIIFHTGRICLWFWNFEKKSIWRVQMCWWGMLVHSPCEGLTTCTGTPHLCPSVSG